MDENNDRVRPLVLIVAILLVFPVLMVVFAWPMMGMFGGGHMWDGGGMWSGTGASWMWLLMGVMPVLLLLGGGYLLYRVIGRSGNDGTGPALEEFRIAYARGELSNEESEERRERLRRERGT